ncbi:YciE/YciF ferroxidase family protein [Paenimyroides aestuarii]|uniref:Ferritin-like domain-containing protein n=1 Tax=Paenimyroides aestuarii TaxID=2968490 RepID=A0ABY5NT79_9FLAO|nr:ferritin-like domain-containing protein [Paenimyroides aestuarii]UUV21772.1 ferritin-like domain-containing protein [Paenimyroides aestuarii]
MSQKDLKEKTIDKSAPSKSEDSKTIPVEEPKNTSKSAEKSLKDTTDSKDTDNNTKKNQSMEDKNSNSELKTFFVEALQDIYYAEAAIEQSLAKIKNKATCEELQEALEDHELVTKKQILRLEKVFKLLGKEAKKKKCDAIDGILKEVDEMVKNTEDGSMTRDVAIIIGAQKVEHYEIATYGGLAQIAITLGYEKVADLLEANLDEEEDTDYLLTEIAEEHVNFEAAEE